jgi:hypothetical protein
MKMKLKGNMLTVDMNEKEETIFFCEGLQSFADKWFPNKIKVLSIEEFEQLPKDIKNTKKTKKKIKQVKFDDDFSEECVKEGILSSLKIYLEKLKKEDKIKKK